MSAYVDMLMERCLFDGPGLHGPELCCARSQRVMTAQMRRPSGPVSIPHPVTEWWAVIWCRTSLPASSAPVVSPVWWERERMHACPS